MCRQAIGKAISKRLGWGEESTHVVPAVPSAGASCASAGGSSPSVPAAARPKLDRLGPNTRGGALKAVLLSPLSTGGGRKESDVSGVEGAQNDSAWLSTALSAVVLDDAVLPALCGALHDACAWALGVASGGGRPPRGRGGDDSTRAAQGSS